MLLTDRPLKANETYTQAGRDRFGSNDPVGGIRGLVYASHAGTLYLEESDDDGTTWSQTGDAVSVAAKTTTELLWTNLTKQQYRFRYVNGAAAQTKFRLVQQTRWLELVSVTDTVTQAALASVLAALQDTLTMQLSGSNTRKRFSSTITIGTGAAHSAGDVVSTDAGAIMEFDLSSLLTAGQSGIIYDSQVTLDQNAVFSGGMGYELYLFNVSPTAQATNAVFNLTDTDLPGYIGKLLIPPLVDEGDNCVAEYQGHNLSFNLAVADTKLYAKAKCLGGETTVSGAVLTYNLGIGTL